MHCLETSIKLQTGKVTTSTVTCSCIWHLCKYTVFQKKLYTKFMVITLCQFLTDFHNSLLVKKNFQQCIYALPCKSYKFRFWQIWQCTTSQTGNACFHSTGSVANEQSWPIDQTITDNATDEWRGHFRTCAGKRRTLWASTVTIFSHMTRDISVFVKCGTIFRFLNYHKFELLNFTG